MLLLSFAKALPFPFSHQREIGYYLMSEISSAVFRKDQELYKLSLELEVRVQEKTLRRCSSISFDSRASPTFNKRWYDGNCLLLSFFLMFYANLGFEETAFVEIEIFNVRIKRMFCALL